MPSKRSEVWKYFLEVHNDSAQCLMCNKVYSRKGRGTTSLKNHLKSMHKEQCEALLAEERKKSEARQMMEKAFLEKTQSDSIQQGNVAEYFPNSTLNIQSGIEQRNDEYFQSATLWNASNSKSIELEALDNRIAEMLVMDDLPFSHVEDIGFMRLMAEAAPQYWIKQQNFYSSLICNDMYESVFNKIKGLIDEVKQKNKISFTTHVWPASVGTLLMSLSAHAINKEFEKIYFVLGAEPLDEWCTGEHISKFFDDMLVKWGISHVNVHCFMCDAGVNMKRGLSLSCVNNLDCALHKIQLIIRIGMASHIDLDKLIQKCHSITSHYHHSIIAQNELKLQVPELSIVNDMPERWNSTLNLLKRALEIKEYVSLSAAADVSSEIKKLSNTEWLIMSKCVQALQPYEDITEKMGEFTSTAAEVLPLAVALKLTLQQTTIKSEVFEGIEISASGSKVEPDTEFMIESQDEDNEATLIVNMMKQTMQTEVDKIIAWIESEDLYRVATYLDPRYKSKFFSSSHITDQVKSSVVRLVYEELIHVNTLIAKEGEEPQTKQRKYDFGQTTYNCGTLDDAMTSLLASTSDDEPEVISAAQKTAIKVIERYHKEKRISGTSRDSVQWWKMMSSVYPDLAKIACQYLGCPPSSVPNDQLFNGTTGLSYLDKCKQLQPESSHKVLFLKRNLPILNFKY